MFSQNLFSPIWPRIYHELFKNFFSNIYWKFHLVLNDVNFKSQVDRVDMVECGYYGEWYTLLIIDIIDWNDLEFFFK